MDSHDREAPALTGAEGEQLIASANRSREADRRLAAALRGADPARPTATLGYVESLGRRPPLDPEAERDLVVAAQAGDTAARARLVEAFMPLIASVSRVYRDSPQVERVELLQEGVVGLLRAIERYDPARGVPFWGYATFWVRQAMQQLVSELTRPLVLSDRALRQLSHIKDAHRLAVQESGREPGSEELAARAQLTVQQVENLLAADRPPRSTDEPVEAEDGAVGLFGDLLVDPLAHGEYERVLDAIEVQELLAIGTLGPRARRAGRPLRTRRGGAELAGGRPAPRVERGARASARAPRTRQARRRRAARAGRRSGLSAT
jgi:DNA-directed RNA polymerase sigma subunit (sigma70/sigma32)